MRYSKHILWLSALLLVLGACQPGGTPPDVARAEQALFGDSELAAARLWRLTAMPYDERSVSLSADGAVSVWEGEAATGKRAVFVGEGSTVQRLALSLAQRQPLVSANGHYIAWVRDLSSGNHRFVRFDRGVNGCLVLWGQAQPIEFEWSHPSVSDDGSRLEVGLGVSG